MAPSTDQNTGLALTLAALCAAGCGDTDVPGTKEVSLRFEARVGDESLTTGKTYQGLGSSESDFTPDVVWMYLYDLKLLDAGGGETPVTLEDDGQFQTEEVAMLAFEAEDSEALRHTRLTGTAPAGTYNGLAFRLGLPPELNHANPVSLPAPLNFTEMSWGWIAGHKFLRLDADTSAVPGWRLHLGSTGCSGDPGGDIDCQHANIPQVRLEGLDPEQGVVVLDLAKLLAGSDLSQDLGGSPGCMAESSDPECAPLFDALGLDADGQPTDGQTFLELQ